MDSKQQRTMKFINPELEIIRNAVIRDSAEVSDEWIDGLIKKTTGIHAGFLFEDEKTLQDVCLFIGETQNKLTDPGWAALGYHLGLNPSAVKIINHNNFNKEDPTYNTLLAYVQFEDATIGKIIEALKKMGRIDVISRTQHSINDLADIILQHGNNISFSSGLGDNSDYGSLQMLEGRNSNSNSGSNSGITDTCSNNNNCGNLHNQNHKIPVLKPNVIPPAPFIFKNIRANRELLSQRIQESLNKVDSSLSNSHDVMIMKEAYEESVTTDCKIPRAFESIQCSTMSGDKINRNVPSTAKKYGKIVMLTFAQDGDKYAKEICKILRRSRESHPRIGVLVLSEHSDNVTKDPHNFITGSFCQVDYVVPILTESYFNVITRKETSADSSDLHLDARYVQFIYSLMNKYYINNKCVNDKIRCVIPDKLIPMIQCNLLMSTPIFSAWMRMSEVEDLAKLLLKSKT